MIDKLIEIKQKSNVLYYLILALIAVPVLGLVFVSVVSPAIRSYLVNSAQKLMNSSRKKDEELKSVIDNTEKEISKNEGKIESIDDQIRKEQSSSDVDWHKKWNK